MKTGILKIGICLGTCLGLLIVMMLIGKLRFPAGEETNSWIIDQHRVAAEAPSAATWADARRTMVPIRKTRAS